MPTSENPLAPYHFQVELRPRFSDLDAFGHVNNARYFTYFEEARSAYLEHLGILLPPASPVSIVIQHAECTYLAPVQPRQLVRVHLRSHDWGHSHFSFSYALWLPREEHLAATSASRVVAWDLKQRRSTAIPPDCLEKMLAFEQGS